MRTFLAFDIASDLAKELNKIIQNYKNHKNIKWVEKENLHITLQFIGDTEYQNLSELGETFYELFQNIPRFNIVNPVIEIVPYKKPKIVWVRVDADNPIVSGMIRKLRVKLSGLGYNLKEQSSKLHITLGRINGDLSESFFSQFLSEKVSNIPSLIERITFYESILKKNGPEYFLIQKYDLI